MNASALIAYLFGAFHGISLLVACVVGAGMWFGNIWTKAKNDFEMQDAKRREENLQLYARCWDEACGGEVVRFHEDPERYLSAVNTAYDLWRKKAVSL